MACPLHLNGWVIMDSPLSPIFPDRVSPVVRSRIAPAQAGNSQGPLERLRALASQDLSPVERAQIEQEIHTWEQHSRLQDWRRRHRSCNARD